MRDEKVTGHESSAHAAGAAESAAWGGPVLIRSVTLTGIFVLLLLYTLRAAATILIPITLAYIMSLLLAPLVARMRRARIPEPIGAGMVIVAFLAVLVGAVYGLSNPAQTWLQRAPLVAGEIEAKLRPLSEPIKEAKKAAEKVEQLAEMEEPRQEVKVEIQEPGLVSEALVGTPKVLAGLGIVIVLLYFLLAAGDGFLNRIVAVIPKLKDKKRAVGIMRDIQRDTSHYLLTRTVINMGLGTAVAVVLFALGVPNPVLWGVMAGVLNFAPYIGPAASIVVLTPVAILSIEGLGHALMVPFAVFVLNVIEGQLLTPHIMGRRLSLSPVAVFISIVVWGWMWGVAGALMAIPLLAAFNVVCQRIDSLNFIAEFVGAAPGSRRARPEQQSAAP